MDRGAAVQFLRDMGDPLRKEHLVKIVTDYLDTIDWKTIIDHGVRFFFILLFAFVVLLLFRNFLKRMEHRLVTRGKAEGEPPTETVKRAETLFRLARRGGESLIFLVFGLVLLQEAGIEIGPLLAGAGILGVAVGFGSQNLVRDIISGFFFILENQVRVGDVAVINGTGGLVEKINFRTIVLRDQAGVVHVFPNGTIATLSNMTYEWSAYVFEIGVAYKENTDRVVEILRQVCDGMRTDEVMGPLIIEDAEIFGVDKLDDSAVVIKGRIKTKPIRQWMVGREFLRRVKHAFDEEGIEIPFPHRTLYFGDASKPFELKNVSAGDS